MEPIFDRQGRTVGWFENGVIHEHSGHARAFVDNGVVVSYRAQHLGWLDQGYFRDRHGDAVGFIRGARSGPLPPHISEPPVPPVLNVPPAPPVAPMPPAPAAPSQSWSSLDWEHYLGARPHE